MKGNKKVSIYDIAKIAGVSVASVSYVINGKGKVGEKTKQRILKAMEQTGYIPDTTAVSLSTGKSNLIGLCLPFKDASEAFVNNPFYGEFLGYFEKEMVKEGYDVIVGSLMDAKAFTKWVKSRKLEGIVMLGLFPNEIYEAVQKLDISVVLVDVYESHSPAFKNIRVDDRDGMYKATKYLIEQGHAHIGFIGGDVDNSLVDDMRFDGYVSALKDNNIELDSSLVYRIPATFDGGYAIAEEIASHIDTMTAVVCAADIIAIGVIRRLNELGHKIPDELSIVGFDDIQAARYIYPALTTVHQSIREKGRLSAFTLLNQLKGVEENSGDEVITKTSLMIRQSVKNIKK